MQTHTGGLDELGDLDGQLHEQECEDHLRSIQHILAKPGR